jgi:hypothetical protein
MPFLGRSRIPVATPQPLRVGGATPERNALRPHLATIARCREKVMDRDNGGSKRDLVRLKRESEEWGGFSNPIA